MGCVLACPVQRRRGGQMRSGMAWTASNAARSWGIQGQSWERALPPVDRSGGEGGLVARGVTVLVFVLVWCEAAQAGVSPVGVVAGEPFEDRPAGCGPVGVAVPVDELSFEAGEERLGHGVVRSRPHTAHRLGETPAGDGLAELPGRYWLPRSE